MTLPRSTYRGRARPRPLLRPNRRLRIALPEEQGEPVVRVLPDRVVHISRVSPGRYTARLPAAQRRGRLVVETRFGFFAADLRPSE